MEALAQPNAGWFGTPPRESDRPVADWHPVDLHLMLVRDRQLLVVRESGSRTWMFPSGELHASEAVPDGARRIGLEQVTVDVAPSGLFLAHVHRHTDPAGPRVGLVVRAGRFRGIPLVPDRRAFDKLGWCSPARLPEPTAPLVPAAIAAAAGTTATPGTMAYPGIPWGRPEPFRGDLPAAHNTRGLERHRQIHGAIGTELNW